MLPSPGNLRPVKDKKQALRYLCLGERMINMSLEWSNKSETEKEKFRSVLASMTLNIMEIADFYPAAAPPQSHHEAHIEAHIEEPSKGPTHMQNCKK